MKAYDIVGYTYKAAIYDTECITDVMRRDLPEELQHPVDSDGGEYPWDAEWCLKQWAELLGIDWMDEHTFDSDNFPKVVFASQMEDDETCEECQEII